MARAKAQPAEVEVKDVVVTHDPQPEIPQVDTPSTVEEVADDFLAEPVNQEEFNEFIQQLVENFVEQKVAGLDERIRDLETLLGQISMSGPGVDEPVPFVPTTTGVPEYRPAEQSSGGAPWYQG